LNCLSEGEARKIVAKQSFEDERVPKYNLGTRRETWERGGRKE
jgi:hypothetical protein